MASERNTAGQTWLGLTFRKGLSPVAQVSPCGRQGGNGMRVNHRKSPKNQTEIRLPAQAALSDSHYVEKAPLQTKNFSDNAGTPKRQQVKEKDKTSLVLSLPEWMAEKKSKLFVCQYFQKMLKSINSESPSNVERSYPERFQNKKKDSGLRKVAVKRPMPSSRKNSQARRQLLPKELMVAL